MICHKLTIETKSSCPSNNYLHYKIYFVEKSNIKFGKISNFQNYSKKIQILTTRKPNLNTFKKPFWKYGGKRGGVEPTPTLVPLTCWINHPMAIFPSWVLNLKLKTHLKCLEYVPKIWDLKKYGT
jgi:hypothetical protein